MSRLLCSGKLSSRAGSSAEEHLTFKGRGALKLLHRLSVAELSRISGLSRSYICQVRHGKCPPSARLLKAIIASPYYEKPDKDYIHLFLRSREASGCSPRTVEFYEEQLVRFLERISSPYWKIPREELTEYLNSIPGNQWGCSTRHAAFRVLRAFYRWLRVEYDLPDPTAHLRAPRIGKPILPTLTREQVEYLLEHAGSIRDKAIIALLTESGLRLSELANIKPSDIDWQARTVRVIGKGRKEALAPFGSLTEGYLREWLSQYSPNGTIWDIDVRGIQIMLTRLKQRTGLPCNPHTFRRTFAVLLRKAGVDCLTIKELGRWESVAMVERYTRSFNFQDAMKFYKAPLG